MKKGVKSLRRIFNCLTGRQAGVTLLVVLLLLVLGAVLLTPALSFVMSGLKQGQAHEETMQQFYAADTGIEDAMWKIKNYEDEDWPLWMRGEWSEATYTEVPAYWEYTIPQPGGVNGKDVTVRIQPTWILDGMEDRNYSADKRTPNDNVTLTGDVASTQVISSDSYQGRYEVAILKDLSFTDPLIVNKIGIWLPAGFAYVAGSSNLENLSVPVPPTGYRCTPTISTFRNGTAIMWTYSTPIDYAKLPMDKSGKATVVSSGRLVDTTNNQFAASDVGRSIYNATDDMWGMVTGYINSSTLAIAAVTPRLPDHPSTNLFDTVNDRYEIGDTNRRVVSFSFTGPRANSVNKLPEGAFSWVRSPGSTTPSVSPYLWWTGDKLYQIVSTGADPVTGDKTTMTVYTTKEQLKDFGGAANADYEAIGNTLLMDYNVDNPYGEGDVNGADRGDGLYRDRLYYESPATLTSLRAGTRLLQLRLYWSGWKNDPWNAWSLTEEERSDLVSEKFLDIVSFKVESLSGGLVYETTVIADADSRQVLPHGTPSVPRGWNYSCYADVTDEVEAAEQYFGDYGVAFIGNAKYTVGHADSSEFTTQPLQGVWGSSASDVFVAGQGGSILHYDGTGTTWDLINSGTTRHLYGVWGRSATDVFAVGGYGTILHYDGSAWSSMTSGTDRELRGVWGDSSYTYVVGASGTILRCAVGTTTWSAMTSGTTNTLYGVWGSASNNVFAVGASSTIRRYNGSSWSTMTSGTTGQTLYGVWGRDSTHVYAVGSMPSSGYTRIQFYNGSGSTWTAQDSGVRQGYYGVWGDSSYTYAVGASGTIRRCAVGSTTWNSMSSGTTTQLNGIWGSASDNILSVGSGGIIIQYDSVDDNGDGSLWDPMIGDTQLYEWKDSHSGETVILKTAYPLASTTTYGTTRIDQAAFGAWSMIVIYSSPETKGHQLYLYDTFRFYWHREENFAVQDFLAPQDVLTDPNAARLTCFIAEGDDVLTGDTISVNGTPLFGGVPYACNPVTNVWNSKSSVAGMDNIGIDIDTFALAYPIVQPGDTSAVVRVYTNDDGWCMVYMVLSFRSDITSGGISSIKIE